MLRRTLISVAALSGLVFASTVEALPAVGQKAPDFTLTDTAGKTVRLSDFKGHHVVLEWVNPGCPYVRKHYNSANMQGTQREVTGKGVVWLAINSTEITHYDYLAPAPARTQGQAQVLGQRAGGEADAGASGAAQLCQEIGRAHV